MQAEWVRRLRSSLLHIVGRRLDRTLRFSFLPRWSNLVENCGKFQIIHNSPRHLGFSVGSMGIINSHRSSPCQQASGRRSPCQSREFSFSHFCSRLIANWTKRKFNTSNPRSTEPLLEPKVMHAPISCTQYDEQLPRKVDTDNRQHNDVEVSRTDVQVEAERRCSR